MKYYYLLYFLFFSVSTGQWIKVAQFEGNAPQSWKLFRTNEYFFVNTGKGILRTHDPVTIWDTVSLPFQNFSSLVTMGQRSIASTPRGMFLSNDQGITWTAADTTILHAHVATSGPLLFAGTQNGMFMSKDSGASWNKEVVLPDGDYNFISGTPSGVVTNGGGKLHYRPANGESWNIIHSGWWFEVSSLLFFQDTNIIISGCEVSSPDVPTYPLHCYSLLTTNFGTAWEQILDNGKQILGLYYVSDLLFAVLTPYHAVPPSDSSEVVFVSSDQGRHWRNISKNLPADTTIHSSVSFSHDSNFLYLAYNDNIWRLSFSDVLMRAEQDDVVFPRSMLLQNYPNPFNPTTVIKYQLPVTSTVTLKIFDLLGREVATLVNEQKRPGSYEVTWDAKHISSGVYFYRLQAGDFVQTRRLVLQK
ncbi:MAG: T9SS type A sorting domain-containing protein [Bacteroidota bacterium]